MVEWAWGLSGDHQKTRGRLEGQAWWEEDSWTQLTPKPSSAPECEHGVCVRHCVHGQRLSAM